MNIYEQLIKTRDDFRREGNAKMTVIASTIIGEIQRTYPKGTNDLNVVQILKKLLKSIESSPSIDTTEVQFIARFLPSELTEYEIRNIIDDIPFDSLGEFMTYMKSEYPGRYNGKTASDLWKECVE